MAGKRYKQVRDALGLDKKNKKPTVKGLPVSPSKKDDKDYDPSTLRPLKEPEKPVDPATLAASYEIRLKNDKKESDIGEVWKQQERIRKADKQLQDAYKQTQKRAKLLKKELKKRTRNGDVPTTKVILGPELQDTLSEKKRVASVLKTKSTRKVTGVIPTNHIKSVGDTVHIHRIKLIIGGATLAVGAISVIVLSNLPKKNDVTISQDENITDVQGEATEKKIPSYSVLTPEGKDVLDLNGVVRETPSGDEIYTFQDELSGSKLEITEQVVPESFKDDIGSRVQKLAKDFQATNIIQVDDITVYHGMKEKSGVQSLVFAKKDRLIFIRSDKKLIDELWVGYITKLR